MTWYEGDVGANGIRIHYARTGGDKPPVILAHGAGDDGLCWTRVAKELEATYDVVIPTVAGTVARPEASATTPPTLGSRTWSPSSRRST